MTRKNKKKKMNTFAFPAPFVSAAVLMSALALLYLWLGLREEALGKELQALEREYVELNKKCQHEEVRWARMKSPRNLEQVLTRYQLAMDWPRRDQLVELDAGGILASRLRDDTMEDLLTYHRVEQRYTE